MLPDPRLLVDRRLLAQRAAQDPGTGSVERRPLAHRGREPSSVGHGDGNGH